MASMVWVEWLSLRHYYNDLLIIALVWRAFTSQQPFEYNVSLPPLASSCIVYLLSLFTRIAISGDLLVSFSRFLQVATNILLPIPEWDIYNMCPDWTILFLITSCNTYPQVPPCKWQHTHSWHHRCSYWHLSTNKLCHWLTHGCHYKGFDVDRWTESSDADNARAELLYAEAYEEFAWF